MLQLRKHASNLNKDTPQGITRYSLSSRDSVHVQWPSLKNRCSRYSNNISLNLLLLSIPGMLVPCVHVMRRSLFKFKMLQWLINIVICVVLYEHISAELKINVCPSCTMMSKMVGPTSQLSRFVINGQTRWVRQNYNLKIFRQSWIYLKSGLKCTAAFQTAIIAVILAKIASKSLT